MENHQNTRSICVIIPTFNRREYLRTVLQQLEVQEGVENTRIIPVVVVDGSNDGTYEMLTSEFPEIHVVRGPGNWWWTKSINEGIRYSLVSIKPEFVLLFNDDSQVQPNYFQSLLKASAKAGERVIIGSISVTDTAPHKVSFSGVKSIDWLLLKKRSYYRNFELLSNLPADGLYPTFALNGRGTLISTAIIQDLGLLNERSFPQYGSDDDLALRGWKKGYQVLLSYSSMILDRTNDTSKGTAYRKDSAWVFIKSFFIWNSVNYIPKQLMFYYHHGIKALLPFYLIKFLMGTGYAYFFKYKNVEI